MVRCRGSCGHASHLPGNRRAESEFTKRARYGSVDARRMGSGKHDKSGSVELAREHLSVLSRSDRVSFFRALLEGQAGPELAGGVRV